MEERERVLGIYSPETPDMIIPFLWYHANKSNEFTPYNL